jgi:polar amino acid transport system substrate-binding protein
MKRLMYALCSFFIITVSLILPGTGNAECKFVSSWEPWEPYQGMSVDGQFTGIDMDIVKAIFDDMGCSMEFVKMPWKRALISVQNGNIDLTMGASVLPEREKYAVFSLPYRDESFSIFLEKGGNVKYRINEIEDIMKYKIKLGTVRGYYYGPEFEAAMKNPKFRKYIEEVHDDEANIRKMEKGRIKACLINYYVGVFLLKKCDLMDKLEHSPFTLKSGTIHVMFSKKTVSPDIIRRFNESLTKLKNSGKLDQIIKKYAHSF